MLNPLAMLWLPKLMSTTAKLEFKGKFGIIYKLTKMCIQHYRATWNITEYSGSIIMDKFGGQITWKI